MNINITAQDMYQELISLSDDSLAEIWQFIEFVKYKKQQVIQESSAIKLGGLWSDYNVDITENDIKEARHEMWGHLGELNE